MLFSICDVLCCILIQKDISEDGRTPAMQEALKCVGVILVSFDVSDLDSLKECDEWIDFILKDKSSYATIVAAGNVADGAERKISTKDASERFGKKGAMYMEIPESESGYSLLDTVYDFVSKNPKGKRNKSESEQCLIC